MRGNPVDDNTILEAIEAQNRGDHRRASALYQEAGNQMRRPQDKKELWAAADREKRIYQDD